MHGMSPQEEEMRQGGKANPLNRCTVLSNKGDRIAAETVVNLVNNASTFRLRILMPGYLTR